MGPKVKMKICGFDNLGNLVNGKMINRIMDAFGRMLTDISDSNGKKHRLISRCPCERMPPGHKIIELKKDPAQVLFSGYIYDAEPMHLQGNRNIAVVKIKEPHSEKKRMVEIPISHFFHVDK